MTTNTIDFDDEVRDIVIEAGFLPADAAGDYDDRRDLDWVPSYRWDAYRPTHGGKMVGAL